MKNGLPVLSVFLLLLWIISCSKNKATVDESDLRLFPKPKVIPLNIKGGYIISELSGDTIKTLINSLGDTLLTGIPIPVKGKVINSDSVSKPKRYTITKERQNLQNISNSNKRRIPNKISSILVDHSHLKVVKLGEGNQDLVLKNSTGDTIRTGVSIPAKGRKVKTSQPHILTALPPRLNDYARQNMQYLDIEHGMNSSYVWSILEDQKGNIWFSTLGGGVSRYDGKSFIHFTEKEGLSNNYVLSLLEDKHGNLWFGTYGGGVSKYDGKSFVHFTEKEGLVNNNLFSILEDKNGHLWFGTEAGGVSKYDGKSFVHFTMKEGLSHNYIRSILEDKNGHLWFCTLGGGVSKFDGKSFVHFTEKDGLSHNNVLSTLEDKKGHLWFGTEGGGVSKYDGKSFIHFTEKDGLCNNNVLSILEDENGHLWFGTEGGGVCKYDGMSFVPVTEKDGLSNNNVFSILEDKNGHLWFGTSGGGVSTFSRRSFIHYTKEDGLTHNNVFSILEDRNGHLWFGTNGSGVSKYDGESFVDFTEKDGLSNNNIWSILEDREGHLWFGTSGGGVSKYDGKSFVHFTEKEGLSHNSIWSMLEDKNGHLWFGTYGGGVSKYDGKSFVHITEEEGLSNNYVSSIIEDQHGDIWFGTYGGGVSKFDGKSFVHFTEKEGLSHNNVLSILEDKKGYLWFGTYGGGVNKFDGKSFTHFTENEGLSNNIVWSILEDKGGHLWLSTEKGLTQLVREGESGNTISLQVYVKNDGLKSMNFFTNSVCLDSKNRIWWGSGKSLTMLDMKKYIPTTTPPRLYIRQLDINGDFVDYRNTFDSPDSYREGNEIQFKGVQRFENYPIDLELAYHKNHLAIHFVGIDWSAPHKIKYSYVLNGLNNKWSLPSSENKAEYRNLPYGNYTFQVRAVGASGQWSEPVVYNFKINPPWWKTWWAYGIYGLLGFAFLISIVHWRTIKLRRQKANLQYEVELATKEITWQKIEVEQRKEEIEKAHHELKIKNQEILDSINYAKRIQSAILPPLKLVKEYLPESFVLYWPKDVVAGDFYWMETADDTLYFTAADCTGHGVPGALVSVVCVNGLNRSVREFGLRQPGEILDKTRSLVISEFEKSDEDVKDGMDLALCALKGNTLRYAGANNPLWIIRKGATEVEVIKADKQPIGKYDRTIFYTTHEIHLSPGDTFYLFTDGFVDQFGGDRNKKLLASGLRRVLLSIQKVDMERQRELLKDTFETWKGDLHQLDDVCIIGVRIV